MAKDLLTDDQRKMLAKSFLGLANMVLGALVFGQTFTDVGFSVISIIFGLAVASILYAIAIGLTQKR